MEPRAEKEVASEARGTRALLIAYAPPSKAVLTRAPVVEPDDNTRQLLSGHAGPARRTRPPIYLDTVLLDQVLIPEGRSAASIKPEGTLLPPLGLPINIAFELPPTSLQRRVAPSSSAPGRPKAGGSSISG